MIKPLQLLFYTKTPYPSTRISLFIDIWQFMLEGEILPPPIPPPTDLPEILRISGRQICKVAIFALVGKPPGAKMPAALTHMSPVAVAPLPLAGATSPRESCGFQRGAAGTRFAGSGAYRPILCRRALRPSNASPPSQSHRLCILPLRSGNTALRRGFYGGQQG